ncbi:uncharacterized protein LOC135201288 [Macrobrachium nipponense]|uniref:uncharacterized protein LOC135201288 n=1 Tax=Macrobrachium nipponense TaxID=159736 RepID=UPI0030C823E3
MEFSFCLWFQLRLNTSVPTLFSYAVSETKTNAIFVYVNEGFFSYMNDITRNSTKLKYTFGPLQWYHVCLVKERLSTDSQQTATGGRTTSEASYNIILYLDGHKVYEDLSDVPFPLGGIMVIGQDQDGMGSAFVKDQALIGRVSFMAFAEALGPGDVEALFRCDVVKEPIPIAWRAHGRVSNTSFDICRSSGYRGTLLPYKTDNRRKAQNLCEMVNMRLALPRDEDENRMYSELLSRDDVCHGTPFLSHNIGWLGISYDEESGTLAEADSLRTFSKLDRNISDSKSPSVVLMSNGLWRSNWTRYGCPLCYGKPSGEFYLLGSEESETEVQPEVFYPRVDQDGAFFLYSFGGITVEKRDKWKFIDTNTNTTIASTEEPYFLGRKPWELLNISNDSRFYSHSSQLMLTLTKCSLDEFTCNDGDCIPMEQRCDFRPDCADEGEDETTCNILDIAADYETGSPPPQRPFNITASVSIKKVSSIDIMTETLQVSMRFSIKWCDSRLTFKNLLHSDRVNYLGQHLSTLWLPQLVVLNEETLAGTAEASKDLFVVKNGLPMRIGQDYVYRGAENSLVLKQKQSYYIACKFDMRAFPFDVQDCWINVTIGNAALDSMRLSAVLQTVDRNLKLNEYDVLACNLTVTRTTMVIRVTLRRYPDYHILSSYFPVFLLHLLGYGTLFIDPQDFQVREVLLATLL